MTAPEKLDVLGIFKLSAAVRIAAGALIEAAPAFPPTTIAAVAASATTKLRNMGYLLNVLSSDTPPIGRAPPSKEGARIGVSRLSKITPGA